MMRNSLRNIITSTVDDDTNTQRRANDIAMSSLMKLNEELKHNNVYMFEEKIESYKYKGIIDVICNETYIFNSVPEYLMRKHYSEIIHNATKILCSIKIIRKDILGTLITNMSINDADYFKSMRLISSNYKDIEKIATNYASKFDHAFVLAYSKVKLSDKYIKQYFNSFDKLTAILEKNSFCRVQTVEKYMLQSKNFIKYVLVPSIKAKTAKLSEDVLCELYLNHEKYINVDDFKILLENYSVPEKVVTPVIFDITCSVDHVLAFFKGTKLSSNFLKKYIPKVYWEGYLIENLGYDDDFISELFIEDKDINWDMVFNHIDIFKYKKLLSLLINTQYASKLYCNIISAVKNNRELLNIRYMAELGYNLNSLDVCISKHIGGLEIAIATDVSSRK